MRKAKSRRWPAAVLVVAAIFAAAFVTPFAPAARADSNTDVYSATYTCQVSCALVPSTPDGAFFKTDSSFVVNFNGAELNDFNVFSTSKFKPTDSYTYIVNDGDLTRDHVTIFFVRLTDLTSGVVSERGFLFPGELLAPTYSEGVVSFVDETAAQTAPEPGSVAFLALGLGFLIWFAKIRTAV